MKEKNKTSPVKVSQRKKLATFGVGAEKTYFIENLSVLLSSGMDVGTALNAIKQEIKSKQLRAIIEELDQDIDDGKPLWRALDQTGLLAPHIVFLIRIGEETGRLSENLKAISIQEQKERDFKSKVSSAMMYPIFVFGLTIVIGVGIAWFILPRLAGIFSSLSIELPLITRILIAVGTFIGAYGFIAVPAFIIFICTLFYILFINRKTSISGQYILLSLPAVKKLIQEVELSRFGYIMGTLLIAGLPVVPALKSLSEATTFDFFKKFYIYLYNNIEEGKSFQKSFAEYKGINNVFPVSIQQLIISAEQSGHLPETFLKLGELYEAKTEITTKNLTVLLEPILLTIVWLGVVAVALAVVLPLYSLIGGLNASGSNTTPGPVSVAITFTPTPLPKKLNQVQILDTGTGFLNVRSQPSLNGSVVGRVEQGDIYPYSEIEGDWYQISNSQDATGEATFTTGWVSADFVEEIDDGTIR